MKTYKSDIFGDCYLPESFPEVIALITEFAIDDRDTSYKFVPVRLWRGHTNIDWTIDSAAYRRIQLGLRISSDENDNLRSYEKHLLEQATHKGFRYQDGREITDLELLSKLQHHGAATRLVDFSRNALIGLWFAVSDHPEKTGLLIGVHTHYIGGLEAYPENDNYDKIMDSCEKLKHPIVYEPPTLSSRIAAQHAQFLYSGVSKDKTGSLQLPKDSNAKTFIAISPKMKVVCAEILEAVFDFRVKTLFPDLDGFGMANKYNISPKKMDRW